MTPEQKKIKTYVNAIERKLKVDMEMKARINSDLGTEIHLLLEQGKPVDEVIREMGTPEEVANRFNEEMREYIEQRRSPGSRIFIILSVIFAVCSAVVTGSYLWKDTQSISIIGGADGPTSVFVAGRVGAPWSLALSCLSLCLTCFAAYLITRYHNKISLGKCRAAFICSIISFAVSAAAFFLTGSMWESGGTEVIWNPGLWGSLFSGRSMLLAGLTVIVSLAVLIVSAIKYRGRKYKSEDKSEK